MPSIAHGVNFDTITREWRCKFSAENDKRSLCEIQNALLDVIPKLHEVDGVSNVQRIVCGEKLDFKVITSLPEQKFHAWSKNAFSPEEQFLDSVKKIAGVTAVEVQTFTSMSVRNPALAPGAPTFSQLVENLVELHKLEVQAAKATPTYESDGGLHRILDSLLAEHERELEMIRDRMTLTETEKERRKGAKNKFALPWNDDADKSMWHFYDPSLPKKDGREHNALLGLVEEARLANSSLDAQSNQIKVEIANNEKSLLPQMQQLEAAGADIEAIQEQVCRLTKAMEAGDDKLMNLRYDQIQNIEQIRIAKVNIWRFVHNDEVNEKLKAAEIALRTDEKWWDSTERANLTSYQENYKKIKSDMDTELSAVMDRMQQLIAEEKAIERKLSTVSESAWYLTSEESDLRVYMMSSVFELQTLAWKRSHIRDKQLAILRDLWRVGRVKVMMQRQKDTEDAVASGDAQVKIAQLSKVQYLKHGIQNLIPKVKTVISQHLEESHGIQQRLLLFTHVHNAETDSARQNLLVHIYSVLLEDLRLAWLRKEQTQLVELSGFLRKSLPKDVPVPVISGLTDLKMKCMESFMRLDTNTTGRVKIDILSRTLSKLDPSFTDAQIQSLCKDFKNEDETVHYASFVETLFGTAAGS